MSSLSDKITKVGFGLLTGAFVVYLIPYIAFILIKIIHLTLSGVSPEGVARFIVFLTISVSVTGLIWSEKL